MIRLAPCRMMCAAIALAGLAMLSNPTAADAQRPQPQQPFDPSKLPDVDFAGTISGVRPGGLISLNAQQQPMLIAVQPALAQVQVTGTADDTVLRPKVAVKFNAAVDEEGKAEGKVDTFEVFTPYPNQTFGEVVSGTPSEIAAQVLKYRDGVLEVRTLSKPIRKITVEVAESPMISINVADYTVARPGDKVTVTGKKVNDNQILALQVAIELAQPLSTKKN